MDYKPSDFFIGVIDFFSVILPGALLTFFLKGLLYTRMFGEGKIFPELHNEVQKAIAFLLATYVIGNLIFLAGSLLLDNFVYDKFLRNIFFKKNFDLAYLVATEIREQHLSSATTIEQLIAAGKLNDQDAREVRAKDKREVINTFKWGQDYLSVKFPQSVTEIEKLKADSKFFRSLVVVFIIIGGISLVKGFRIWAASFFILSLLSVYRYGELRYKSNQKAYELIVAVDHLEKRSLPAPSSQPPDNRARFLAPADTVRACQNRIAALTKGLQVSTALLAIPPAETWKVVNSQSSETILCLQGRGLLKTTADRAAMVSVSPGATAPLPMGSTFEMNNSGGETVLVLSVK
jgi:mannose-6-phosphate isomerase-like protein (cupin superfamily)